MLVEVKRLRKEVKQLRKENAGQASVIKKQNETIEEQESYWPDVTPEERRRYGPEISMAIQHVYNMLNKPNDDGLNAVTGCRLPMFEYIHWRVREMIKDSDDAPLFEIEGHRESDPGTRRKLPLNIALVMAHHFHLTNCGQEYLAALFRIDQSTVSRYLDVLMPMLKEAEPVPDWVSEAISGAKTHGEILKVLQSGERASILIDGAHVQILRPGDYDEQKANYSGKKKYHTKNVMIISVASGMIIGTSRPFEGRAHDMRVMKEDFPDFGMLGEMMRNPDTPESEKPEVYTDTGYVGIENVLPGIISRQPPKKPKGGELTEEQKAEGREISRTRVMAEHPISNMKNYLAVGGKFRGTEEQLATVIAIAGGLVNLRILFRNPELWRFLNELAARVGARQIPLPPEEIMKKAREAEARAKPLREKHRKKMEKWREKQNAKNGAKKAADKAKRDAEAAAKAARKAAATA